MNDLVLVQIIAYDGKILVNKLIYDGMKYCIPNRFYMQLNYVKIKRKSNLL